MPRRRIRARGRLDLKAIPVSRRRRPGPDIDGNIPTSLATRVSGRPPLSGSATASRVSAGENSRLVFAMRHLPAFTGLAKVSIKSRNHHRRSVKLNGQSREGIPNLPLVKPGRAL